ncbi:GNAT family N-acetyltransferase [Ktedonosporobacter rubrisoli]|uniref:GNAT family N-acetyltransferase n=1 Tax=Ktedonosporobacter rubrisoli TaxID=2509675 RepID=A0A4P6JI77_KTERU|nr:GNAT family N-acetyltransferase [Ktedonosporobacter rubrisoli]QBD74580.1 GNAT family N-acetyltransferase [Ktedonosporobacter rubrisoli]
MATVREIGPEETGLAYTAFLELRPHLSSREAMIEQINHQQRPEGYRLIGAFEDGLEEPQALAGFRFLHTLAWGYVLYVDDLITLAKFRGKGHAGSLMEWLFAEARGLGCDQLHLDSGPQRQTAHRFYFNQGLHISAYHFAHELR